VTKIANHFQSAMRERAVALHQAGKISEAASMYETLLRVEPANADLWGLLSIAQLLLDRNKKALASWRRCLSIEMDVALKLRSIARIAPVLWVTVPKEHSRVSMTANQSHLWRS
jgi:tetratricopeptide (TPR) repeat protein